MPRVIETNLTEEDKKIEKTLRPQALFRIVQLDLRSDQLVL